MQRLKNYLLVRRIALGGMGEVWLARQEGPAGFSRPVVIKRVLPSFSADRQFVEMFLNEARLAGRLTHPNVVQLIELGQDESDWFMALEYVHGHTLRALLRSANERKLSLDWGAVAAVASSALVGLHYAHTLKNEQGRPLQLVHRDISPDNLMLSYDGVVKVLDFGIARVVDAISTTRPGSIRGKLAYLSPEHVRGLPLDGRADVFAMGAVLYELLTGRRAFHGQSDAEKMLQVLESDPPPAHTINPAVPRALSAIVERALKKERDERFASAADMHVAIDETLASLGYLSTPTRLAEWLRSLVGEPPPIDTEVSGTATHERPGVATERDDAAPPSFKSRTPWVVLATLAVVGLGAAGLALRNDASSAPASPPQQPAAQQEPPELPPPDVVRAPSTGQSCEDLQSVGSPPAPSAPRHDGAARRAQLVASARGSSARVVAERRGTGDVTRRHETQAIHFSGGAKAERRWSRAISMAAKTLVAGSTSGRSADTGAAETRSNSRCLEAVQMATRHRLSRLHPRKLGRSRCALHIQRALESRHGRSHRRPRLGSAGGLPSCRAPPEVRAQGRAREHEAAVAPSLVRARRQVDGVRLRCRRGRIHHRHH
jgi:serine/threonine-protein kinase